MRSLSTRSRLLLPLVVWTLFVWVSRLRNIWSDDELSDTGQIIRTVVAVIFVAFAAATGVRLWQLRGRALETVDRWLIWAFIVWTIGFWLVRGVGIILDDHPIGFTVVHSVLMAISISLAVVGSRAVSDRSISSTLATAR
ncbi:MAG: hypothetical protein ACR2PK_14360 [Acidimicrobiales bacterium]